MVTRGGEPSVDPLHRLDWESPLHLLMTVYTETWLEEAMERAQVWVVWELKKDSKQLMKLEM